MHKCGSSPSAPAAPGQRGPKAQGGYDEGTAKKRGNGFQPQDCGEGYRAQSRPFQRLSAIRLDTILCARNFENLEVLIELLLGSL